MPRRGRPRKGDRRIDAAIDHFAAMGYAARDVRAIIDRLLKEVYGGVDAWPLLEEGSYQVVQDLLFEQQEEEEKELLRLEHQPQGEEEQQLEVGQEPPQQQVAEDEVPPENNMAMLEVHNEKSAAPDSPDKGVEDPVLSELPALQAVMPYPIAIGNGGSARPCYGWISESDDEEEITWQQLEVHVQSLEGGPLCKRKRLD